MKTWAIILITVFVGGCSGIVETVEGVDAAAGSTPVPTYNCSYYSEYDSLSDCQSATSANCSWEWKAFPSGGSGVCYKPVVGWESCASTPATWIYTPWNLTCRDSGTLYRIARSVVSCSNTVCACLAPQAVTATCSDGVDCAGLVAIPTPSPTPNCP